MKTFEIIDQLYEIGCIKFGSFKLKSGMTTPFYIDLRLLISYPKFLETVAEALWKKMQSFPCDRLCGVPYNALPIATAISLKHNVPMILKRKELKDYGTKQIIEGVFNKNDQCVVIEDVIVSGKSILETIIPIQASGLQVSSVLVIVDREQGGTLAIEKQGIHVTSLMTISEIFHHLRLKGKISQHEIDIAKKFIEHHQAHF